MSESQTLPNQKNILSTCNNAWVRGPGVGAHVRHLSRVHDLGLNVRVAGVSPIAIPKITQEIWEWAGIVFAADDRVRSALEKKYGNGRVVVGLDLPNVYWPNGAFSCFWLNRYLASCDAQERDRICSLNYVQGRWPLREVIQSRDLGRYLLK